MSCWFCYWGWPKPIADIYDRYIDTAGHAAMHYGPAHVVWDDENFDCAEVCLEDFAKHSDDRHTPDELAAVRRSLEALAALPMELREWPEAYANDDHGSPADYPPPAGMVMVRR
jgi:hypothetical protein